MKVRGRIVTGCRVVVLIVCVVVMLDGRHPPAWAQAIPQMPAQSEAVAIAVESEHVKGVEKSVDANTKRLEAVEKSNADLKAELAGSHQESRIESGAIALATILQLILGRGKKKNEDDE